MKFSTRDLFWFTIVVALATVLLVNMFSFKHAKQEREARHKQEIAELAAKLAEAQQQSGVVKTDAVSD